MTLFQTVVSPTLGVLEIAGAVSGIPYIQGAGMALQVINTTCNQVVIHKRKSAQLAQRCNVLLNLISEHAVSPACDEVRSSLEEAEFVLYAVRDRLQKWSQYSKVRSFLKSSQIEQDLDKCQNDVNTVMERLHVRNPLNVMLLQKQSMDMMKMNQSRLEERLEQLMISPQQVQDAAQRHSTGGQDALDLMRIGQQASSSRLMQLQIQSPRDASVSPEPVFEGPMVESPVASRSSSLELMVQAQIQSALTDLRRLTKIPPTLKVLNNQVKKINSSSPLRSGQYSDIWLGEWLGETVALKTLRILTDPHKAGKMTKRYEHEMNVWSMLKHDNILSIYGVITNLETIHIVSTWQENGNVLEYRIKNPDINPLTLATSGIEYLHGSNIVHGNLKCNNMLVSSEGVACISDFGHTQVLDEVLGRDVFTSYTATSNARWNAPELLRGDDVKPTKASDVFAFGMSILELITKQAPYSHRKRDLSVIQDVNDGRLPLRPTESEDITRWMHDELWGILNGCWRFAAPERLSIEDVRICFEILAKYLGEHPNWKTEEADEIAAIQLS
ncbi:kinase-like protein [Rhizopogon vinicolor AM-OR11-026]|uniref:Kinase-like protein n=1 Tax=Rhizopogon vinicolor AM-OR11-026 TaxID=1314800 RepID=A0A1B7NGA5_9AGAM|nr:kinase-like protein [Rhizopogon vinicolor AM-OR11-026]